MTVGDATYDMETDRLELDAALASLLDRPGGDPRVVNIESANSDDPAQLPEFFDAGSQTYSALATELTESESDGVITHSGESVTFERDDGATITVDLSISCEKLF